MIELAISIPTEGNSLDRLAAYPERYAFEAQAAMLQASLLLEREVKDLTPVGVYGAAGLRGSIAAMPPRMEGDTITGGVSTSCPYALPVELGSKPHFPPVQPLEDWVRAKLGESDPDVARGIAFCIARKIAAHGTKGQHMFQRALDASKDQIAAFFNAAVENALNSEGAS